MPIGLKISFLELGIMKTKSALKSGTTRREIIIPVILAPSE